MVKLRGMDVILWREEQKRKVGTPTKAPHLQFISRYVCGGCSRVFYYKSGDAETPQYQKIKGKTKPVCHKCFHKLDNGRDLHNPSCWLCELRTARKARANGYVQHPRSIEETGQSTRDNALGIEQTTEKGKQGRVPSGSVLSSGRGTGNNKKNRRAGR